MPAARKREQKKQERREEILAAAVRVFLRRTVQGATMDEIAREADVSKGTLYLYFASKDELFLSVAIEWLDQLQVQVDAISAENHESGLELIRAGLKLYARHALRHPGHFKVAMSWLNTPYDLDEGTPLFQDYRRAIAEKHHFLVGAMQRGKADGSVLSTDPIPRSGIQLWGAMLGVILVEQNSEELARRLPFPPPTEGVAEAFIDKILSALTSSSECGAHPSKGPEEEES